MSQQQPTATLTQRSTKPARPLAALSGPLGRALAQLDSALVGRLSRASGEGDRELDTLEAWLLWRTRMGLVGHIKGQQSAERVDPVVAETLLEAVDFATSLIDELEQGGLARLMRLWQGCREVVSELVALGIDVSRPRQALLALRTSLLGEPATLSAAQAETLAIAQGLAELSVSQRTANSLSPLEQLLTHPR